MVPGVGGKKKLSSSWIVIHNFYDMKNLKFTYLKIMPGNLHM